MKIKDAKNFEEISNSFEIDFSDDILDNFNNRFTRELEKQLLLINKNIAIETIKVLFKHYDEMSNVKSEFEEYFRDLALAHLKLLKQLEETK